MSFISSMDYTHFSLLSRKRPRAAPLAKCNLQLKIPSPFIQTFGETHLRVERVSPGVVLMAQTFIAAAALHAKFKLRICRAGFIADPLISYFIGQPPLHLEKQIEKFLEPIYTKQCFLLSLVKKLNNPFKISHFPSKKILAIKNYGCINNNYFSSGGD